MSNYPSQLDSDAELPRVDNNLSDIGALAINSLRAAMFAVERELGIGAAGSAGSTAARLLISVNADGTLKPSAIIAAGAIVGPISNDEVSPTAAIDESKLNLYFSTQFLYNEVQSILSDINNLLSLQANQNVDFIKHITGATPLTNALNGRHVVSHIDINDEPDDSRDEDFTWPSSQKPRDRDGSARPSNLALFLLDLSDELVAHELADGLTHTDGYTADTYSHPARSVSVDGSEFIIVPTTVSNLQEFAEFVDANNFAGLTNHQQNQHTNGVSRTCRGGIISGDGYGTPVIPSTLVTVYLNAPGTMADNNIDGDDVIEFTPDVDTTFYFDTLFAQVRAGQVITVNYGSVESAHIIESVRFSYDGDTPPNRKYLVRINGRNVMASTTAVARIDKAKFSTEDKYGVLAISGVNNSFNALSSLIVSDPRGAVALGLGFSAAAFDSQHYNLYLEMYPTGNPLEKAVLLPAIDVTGNRGITPGKYTLDSIVESTNAKLRQAGFNYRMVAFSYSGEFGIMMADSIGGVSFSIRSGIRDTNGAVVTGTLAKNVIGISDGIDPLGFGSGGANLASVEFATSFTNISQSQTVTKIFSPLRSKNFYVDGIERDALHQITDGYNDDYNNQYWYAQITSKNIIVGATVQATYRVDGDLRAWDLRPGKTIVVQPQIAYTLPTYNELDYGRFIIQSVSYVTCGDEVTATNIQVYNAVHAAGAAIASTSVNIPVRLYFSDDSVAFDRLNMIDPSSAESYKRYFEVFVDSRGHSFTHERARFNVTETAAEFNLVKVSPKLRGYTDDATKIITLYISDYDPDGYFSGYLCQDSITRVGPTVYGKRGSVSRFYDETYVDYIDAIIDVSSTAGAFSSESLAIELFPSLALDQEAFLLATCQVNDSTKRATHIQDARQFGNISENEFSTSAIDFISAASRFNTNNGVIRGFEYVETDDNIMTFSGGLALVNGKYIDVNNFIVAVPFVQNYNGGTPSTAVTWALCLKSNGQIALYLISDDVPGGKLYNPANLTNYSVETVTFEDLLATSTTRKDLTVLYFVYATVTSSTAMTLTQKDARHSPVNSGASQVLPTAILTVSLSGSVATLTDAKTTFLNTDLTRFTVVRNSAGNVTIHWTANELIPTTGGPVVSQCDDTEIDRIRAYYTTVSGDPAVQVKTSLGGVATDASFVVTIY